MYNQLLTLRSLYFRFGDERDDQLKSMQKLFKKNFEKAEGGKLDGVALGIAGDTVSWTFGIFVALFPQTIGGTDCSHQSFCFLKIESIRVVETDERRDASCI